MENTQRKLVSTIGLNVDFDQYKTRKLVKVWFEQHIKNGDWVATVESARTGGRLEKLGKVTLTHEQFCDLPDDPYDDAVFASAAFKLFGGTI